MTRSVLMLVRCALLPCLIVGLTGSPADAKKKLSARQLRKSHAECEALPKYHCLSLAKAYERGYRMEPNSAEALRVYSMACAADSAEACASAARMHQENKFADSGPEAELPFARRACSLGDADSCKRFALLPDARCSEYFDANADRDGVEVTPTGLQYEVLEAGDGTRPATSDRVRFHIRGGLLDGTEFVSTHSGEWGIADWLSDIPVPSLADGLALMQPGARFRFHIDSNDGYSSVDRYHTGRRDYVPRSIAPHEILVYEVELLEVTPAAQWEFHETEDTSVARIDEPMRDPEFHPTMRSNDRNFGSSAAIRFDKEQGERGLWTYAMSATYPRHTLKREAEYPYETYTCGLAMIEGGTVTVLDTSPGYSILSHRADCSTASCSRSLWEPQSAHRSDRTDRVDIKTLSIDCPDARCDRLWVSAPLSPENLARMRSAENDADSIAICVKHGDQETTWHYFPLSGLDVALNQVEQSADEFDALVNAVGPQRQYLRLLNSFALPHPAIDCYARTDLVPGGHSTPAEVKSWYARRSDEQRECIDGAVLENVAAIETLVRALDGEWVAGDDPHVPKWSVPVNCSDCAQHVSLYLAEATTIAGHTEHAVSVLEKDYDEYLAAAVAHAGRMYAGRAALERAESQAAAAHHEKMRALDEGARKAAERGKAERAQAWSELTESTEAGTRTSKPAAPRYPTAESERTVAPPRRTPSRRTSSSIQSDTDLTQYSVAKDGPGYYYYHYTCVCDENAHRDPFEAGNNKTRVFISEVVYQKNSHVHEAGPGAFFRAMRSQFGNAKNAVDYRVGYSSWAAAREARRRYADERASDEWFVHNVHIESHRRED
ncbi:MAG: hypothetical protein GY716_12580 [bacterium]|nr:hypothetical protein [bacterium]